MNRWAAFLILTLIVIVVGNVLSRILFYPALLALVLLAVYFLIQGKQQ